MVLRRCFLRVRASNPCISSWGSCSKACVLRRFLKKSTSFNPWRIGDSQERPSSSCAILWVILVLVLCSYPHCESAVSGHFKQISVSKPLLAGFLPEGRGPV